MAWHHTERAPDIERMVHDLERRLTQLNRMVGRTSREAPRAADRMSDMLASALTELSDRFGGGARAVGNGASEFSDDALRYGNEAVRKLSHEVEQRPLVMLAVAFGVGALAAGLFARR